MYREYRHTGHKYARESPHSLCTQLQYLRKKMNALIKREQNILAYWGTILGTEKAKSLRSYGRNYFHTAVNPISSLFQIQWRQPRRVYSQHYHIILNDTEIRWEYSDNVAIFVGLFQMTVLWPDSLLQWHSKYTTDALIGLAPVVTSASAQIHLIMSKIGRLKSLPIKTFLADWTYSINVPALLFDFLLPCIQHPAPNVIGIDHKLKSSWTQYHPQHFLHQRSQGVIEIISPNRCRD